jgi:hypothetical protein
VTRPWTVSAGSERVHLNPQGQGEVTFIVTNPGPTDLRAVLDVLPGDNADRAWFHLDQPQCLIIHGGSAPFLVRIAVRPGARPGPYWMSARVYSADGPPEETSVMSDRVAFDVAGTAAKRTNPLVWIIPIVVLVLVVAGVVGWLLLRGGSSGTALPTTTTTAPPTTTTTTQPPAVMADLRGLSEPDAAAAIKELGAKVGTVRHRLDPANDGMVLQQSVPPTVEVVPGMPVDLEVAVALAPAALLAPSNGATFSVTQGMPTVSWQAVPNAAGYRVQYESEVCAYLIFGIAPCIYSNEGSWGPPYTDYHARSFQDVKGTSATPDFKLRIHDGVPRAGHSGNVRWQVFPMDDFGNLGPPSGFFTFHKALRNPDEYGPLPG